MTNKKSILDINNASDEELLNSRMCDFGLRIDRTPVQDKVAILYDELEKKGLSFRPVCYLGDEWFSPGGVPAISIPFYLAHPRLQAVENTMMLEVEGGSDEECMKLLRHECAHAIGHAFNLTERKKWQKVFGNPDSTYQEFYRYRPYSKSYVHHLKDHYAQSHPEEDFAETFAVWLNPNSDWKTLYNKWPAIDKLQYVNTLMNSLKKRECKVPYSPLAYQIKNLKRTLAKHYRIRKKLYAQDSENYFDNDLKKVFQATKEGSSGTSAASYIRKSRSSIESSVAIWTLEKKFTIKRLLTQLIKRCHTLGLYIPKDEEKTKANFLIYFTSLISNYMHTSHFKKP
ncbi:MAG: hypothetical protein COA79_24515 [Planctomycetota bacterium]|nr:MAG: hypothetical protein COA79_24515 [Planctomycetota bacterium]